MAKLQLPFELAKPDTNTYVTQADQIGYNGKDLETHLNKTPNLDSSSFDLEIADEEGNPIVAFSKGHLRTKNFDSATTPTEDNSTSDFEIKDESGNVIMRIERGHLQTPEFDSSLAPYQDDTFADFEIKDDKGNVILMVEGGHIVTKNFDSRQIEYKKVEEEHLKLLIVGNSYAADSFAYVPFILKEYGISIEMGIYLRGSGTLANHISEWSSGNYSFFYIDTRKDSSWHENTNFNPMKAVSYIEWDIITLQQSSVASVDAATFTYARKLINLILDNISHSVQFAWNININRATSGDDYTAIANTILTNIKNCVDVEPINLIFPYGTAIFDARTNDILKEIGDGGNLWYSDHTHLQEGLPCYIAALANTQALFNRFYPKYSVMNNATRPTAAKVSEWKVPQPHGATKVVGINEYNCRLAQIIAITSNKHPFEIKNIN